MWFGNKTEYYMKIGILTQPLKNNYGGLLQNYALQQVLIRNGYEAETLNWNTVNKQSLKEWIWRKKVFLKSFFCKNIKAPRYILSESESAIIGQHTNSFIKKYINTNQQILHNSDDLKKLDYTNVYNAYIVGSDQVWRPRYNQGMIKAMFLDFLTRENVRKIAYAASFGTSKWEYTPQLTYECSNLAKKFDLITVRERSGIELCSEHLGVEAIWVLDPTMLLNREDYEKAVLAEKEPKSEGTLFHYILDPSSEKKALIEDIAAKNGLKSFTVMPKHQAENRTKEDVKKRIDDCVFPSVTKWLRAFMDAKMVVVDSFHGAVFSIIFNKDFWVIDNPKRGNARFISLLEMFHLENRMIKPDSYLAHMKDERIDWQVVNGIRQQEQERCISLLLDALS